MKIKKRINLNRLDIKDEQLYTKTVSICPICGENILECRQSTLIVDEAEKDWLYKATKRKITFKCPKCGCQWNVKSFKG